MVSLCLTDINQPETLLRCCGNLLDDKHVAEIVIREDSPDPENYKALVLFCKQYKHIKISRNEQPVGEDCNRLLALEMATYPWAISFDSANIITKDYIRAFLASHHYETVINMPSKGMPLFDCTRFSKWLISRTNAKKFMDMDLNAQWLLMNGNYVVHRKQYLQVANRHVTAEDASTAMINVEWLKEGGMFFIVPEMHYTHTLGKDLGEPSKERGESMLAYKHLREL